jgi:putative Ca2+/H+ antiporter (TMEM165/GDT1 family)
MLIPDKVEETSAGGERSGAFLTTVLARFLVEIGDKTQVATVVPGARYHAVVPVTSGTTARQRAGLFLVIGALVILI